MIPGSPQTNMYFTLYGFNTVDQARGLIRDLKMARPHLVTLLFFSNLLKLENTGPVYQTPSARYLHCPIYRGCHWGFIEFYHYENSGCESPGNLVGCPGI